MKLFLAVFILMTYSAGANTETPRWNDLSICPTLHRQEITSGSAAGLGARRTAFEACQEIAGNYPYEKECYVSCSGFRSRKSCRWALTGTKVPARAKLELVEKQRSILAPYLHQPWYRNKSFVELKSGNIFSGVGEKKIYTPDFSKHSPVDSSHDWSYKAETSDGRIIVEAISWPEKKLHLGILNAAGQLQLDLKLQHRGPTLITEDDTLVVLGKFASDRQTINGVIQAFNLRGELIMEREAPGPLAYYHPGSKIYEGFDSDILLTLNTRGSIVAFPRDGQLPLRRFQLPLPRPSDIFDNLYFDVSFHRFPGREILGALAQGSIRTKTTYFLLDRNYAVIAEVPLPHPILTTGSGTTHEEDGPYLEFDEDGLPSMAIFSTSANWDPRKTAVVFFHSGRVVKEIELPGRLLQRPTRSPDGMLIFDTETADKRLLHIADDSGLVHSSLFLDLRFDYPLPFRNQSTNPLRFLGFVKRFWNDIYIGSFVKTEYDIQRTGCEYDFR